MQEYNHHINSMDVRVWYAHRVWFNVFPEEDGHAKDRAFGGYHVNLVCHAQTSVCTSSSLIFFDMWFCPTEPCPARARSSTNEKTPENEESIEPSTAGIRHESGTRA